MLHDVGYYDRVKTPVLEWQSVPGTANGSHIFYRMRRESDVTSDEDTRPILPEPKGSRAYFQQ
ncbi:MAG TPA: hypothetical protein VKR59_16815 [Terriglobales bacterium]|nr:hypothetical protein [Terriglobales bacterium]